MKSLIMVLTFINVSPPVSFAGDSAAARVRKLHLKRDEIALVRTAIGIATIIQIPDRPTSVVLGDTNAFKVEYLENAITLKPLSQSAKSNLFIYTEGRRFNVSLVTAPIAAADYIVYLEPEVTPSGAKREKWRNYSVRKDNSDFSVTVTRLGRSDDLFFLAFRIDAPKATPFQPNWIWLTQGRKTVPIQDLELSAVQVSEKTPIHGLFSVRLADLNRTLPPILEIRSSIPIQVRLPVVKSWLK